jgi:hypothetical protein
VGSTTHFVCGQNKNVREWAAIAKSVIHNAEVLTYYPRSRCDVFAFRPNCVVARGVARDEDAPADVFCCGRAEAGIDFLAASGFNDVSSTGMLTFLRKLGGA